MVFSVTGTTKHGPPLPLVNADGRPGVFSTNEAGSENGMSNLNAPLSSLVGVFLSDAQPNTLPAPAALDFAVGSGINFLTLSPLLQQVFFIGDGLTDTSIRQQFLVPLGATRLYLGTMDGYEWNNNSGSLSATVTTVTVTPRDIEAPEPATLIPLGIGLAVMIGLRARR